MSTPWTYENASETPGPILHPLAGTNVSTLKALLSKYGPFNVRSRKQRAVAIAAVMGRFAAYHYENFRWGERIKRSTPQEPPVFVIGHWRSGTTHLHNLLSQDPQFGFINFAETTMPWDMLGKKVELGRALVKKVLPETRGYDNVKLTLEAPQEEEMALGNLNPVSYFYSYYFPRFFRHHFRRSIFLDGLSDLEKEGFAETYRFLIQKLDYVKAGKRLLFKNPPSTARIPLLRSLFPGAKFIHIVRNPFQVYRSSLARFPRLLNAFAWQDFDGIDFAEITLSNYEELNQKYLQDRGDLPSSELFETTFEKITDDPLSEIDRAYGQLGISHKSEALESISRYLKENADYEKNRHRPLDDSLAEQIRQRWAFAFDHWGYSKDQEF